MAGRRRYPPPAVPAKLRLPCRRRPGCQMACGSYGLPCCRARQCAQAPPREKSSTHGPEDSTESAVCATARRSGGRQSTSEAPARCVRPQAMRCARRMGPPRPVDPGKRTSKGGMQSIHSQRSGPACRVPKSAGRNPLSILPARTISTQTELKSARLIQIMMGVFVQEVWTDWSPPWTFTGVQCLNDQSLPEPTEGTCQLQNFVCGTETK